MGSTKTVVLELLRDGPSYNQLLSPLTVYLAACQNRPPESVRLNIEHKDFLRWQGGLTYADVAVARAADDAAGRREASDRSRREAIDDATKAVTGVLGSIRALIAELAGEPCEWRHIHMVLDAAELGSLPFELAYAAPGLMVEGERLFLQQNARVTLTRQTRRVATSVVSWPRRPRVLCIVAEGDLPLDAHVLALRQAIDPWIGWNDGDKGETGVETDDAESELRANRSREVQQMPTVLIDPTLEDISRETRRIAFTHVHVLAHGAPLPDAGPGQTLYGLCFRGARGGTDVVDGDRLEAAIRQSGDCAHPTVVTLATCEGASVTGAILGPGGSVAHALHAKGVPLVVSAQFPLSKGGSAIFAEMLYAGMLRGDDPREIVHAIRRELVVAYPDTHDWASLVVYASLPTDLVQQLALVRRSAETLSIETAVERLRVTLGRWRRSLGSGQPIDDVLRRVAIDSDRLDRAGAVIRSWTTEANDVRVRIAGYRRLARVALRVWDMLAVSSPGNLPIPPGSIASFVGRKPKHDVATGERPLSMLEPRELLELAQICYSRAHALDASQLPLWVQVAFLGWLRSQQSALPPLEEDPSALVEELKALHLMAAQRTKLSSSIGLPSRDDQSMAAAMAFEIALLLQVVEVWNAGDVNRLNAAFRNFAAVVSPVSTSYRAHAMWRQLRRYETVGQAFPVANGYRLRLEELGVRKYWGPRS
jgi:hypothetical protein